MKSQLFSDCKRLTDVENSAPPVKLRFPADDVDAVGRIQRALVVLVGPMPRSFPSRFSGEPDGVYGDETTFAVIKFQKTAFPNDNREWDGIVGKSTLSELDRAMASKSQPAPTVKTYLVVFENFDSVVPKGLQEKVKEQVSAALAEFNLELDFSGKKKFRDLIVTMKDEVPSSPEFASSIRTEENGIPLRGFVEVFVGVMKAFRLRTVGNLCEKTFVETADGLGSMIANTSVHEIGHMLGLNVGGFDGGGHTRDSNNFMFEGVSVDTLVSKFFEYTVKQGDTLRLLIEKFKRGQLDPCRFGATDLTVQGVWSFPPNKDPGFVADPKKGGRSGKIANSPDHIYAGEMIAFQNTTLRTQVYKGFLLGHLGKKSFSDEQKKQMRDFIAERIRVGKF